MKIIKIDDTTGEVKKDKDILLFDQVKYDKDVQLDGYYAIVTSEIDMSVNKIIGSYRDFWKIEESFKVIKSDLQVRPVYVRDNDHIEGYFLTCFIALVMLRTIEYKMKFKFTSKQIKLGWKKLIVKSLQMDIIQ